MRYIASPTRPAIAAIAAVLALQTFSASAQTTDAPVPPADPAPAPTVVAPPVIVPAPSAPAAPSAAPQVIYQSNGPVVQPVPATPAPVQATEAEAVPAKPKKAAPVSTAVTTPKTEAVKQAETPAIVAPAVEPASPAPVAVTTAPPQPATQAPAVATVQDDDGTDAGYWILGMGAALLIGAGSYAALRRRQSIQTVAQPETMYGYKPVTEQDREVEQFVAVNNPADRFKTAEPELMLAPEEQVVEPAEAVEAPTTFAPVESARIAVPPRAGATNGFASRREAMIAGAPSAENPFLTRKNRLRRANFILAKETESTVAPAEAATITPQDAPTRKPEPIQISYGFGKGSLNPPVLKPRYN